LDNLLENYHFQKFLQFHIRPSFVSFLASTEPEEHFHLIAFSEEFFKLSELHLEVVQCRSGGIVGVSV